MPHQDHDRIVIIGAGHVGSTTAYALMLRALVREIVLIDSDLALAEAEAIDISDANALARPARIWAGSYGDAATARLAIITAGAATHGDESRLSVAGRSAAIVRTCVDGLMVAGFDGILIVASNPVDVMAKVALAQSSFRPNECWNRHAARLQPPATGARSTSRSSAQISRRADNRRAWRQRSRRVLDGEDWRHAA